MLGISGMASLSSSTSVDLRLRGTKPDCLGSCGGAPPLLPELSVDGRLAAGVSTILESLMLPRLARLAVTCTPKS